MKYIACCIYDTKAGFYLQPQCFQSKPQAIREYQGLFEQPDSQFAKFPDDFRIFVVGSFDSETGLMESKTLESLITGTDLMCEISRRKGLKAIKECNI